MQSPRHPADIGGVDVTDRVIVVGAGVVGLTCAVALAEAGHRVDVLARDLPGETASSAAARPWLPVPVRLGTQAAHWAARTRAVLVQLAQDPRSGVHLAAGVIRTAEGRLDEVPDVPVVDPGPYLASLTGRLLTAGGTMTRLALTALPAPAVRGSGALTVVNCSGVASRALVPDDRVRPAPRRVLHLSDPGLPGWTALLGPDGDPDLVLAPQPGSGTVRVIGGDEPAGSVLERAVAIDPLLAGQRMLGERLVVHADRDRVRVDVVGDGPGRRLVHCYGFGAHALSLSWGSARGAADLLEASRAGAQGRV